MSRPFHVCSVAIAAIVLGAHARAQLLGHSANSEHNFPTYYVDTAGNTVAHCIDWTDPGCGHLPGEDPAFGRPLDVANGVFWVESFYWFCLAEVPVPGGELDIVFALEGVFGNAAEAIVDGDQTVFSRIRFRMDTASPGTYTILHPFGENTFTNVGVGRRAINYTEDCLHTEVNGVIVPSCGEGVGNWFSTGLRDGISRIDRFLYWDPNELPLAPPGYYGDPNVPHGIAGASNGRNSVIVQGPNVGGFGVHQLEITQFTIMGKRGPSATLLSSPRGIDAGVGGSQTLQLDAGPGSADHFYFLVSSLVNTGPDIVLPNGLRIPLALQDIYVFGLQSEPAPFAVNYAGFLDANGQATATLNIPRFPELAGLELYQSFLSGPPGDFDHASNNVTLSLR
ncbi:MAG: hypothetical protein AB7O97_20885 [Planctomycetota bacterium]